MPDTYPIFMKLKGRRVLVVGGGKVARRKADALSSHGAVLRIVAPKICDELKTYDYPHEILEKQWEAKDLSDCIIAVAATDNPEVNREVAKEARMQRILVNSVDDPDNCDFFVPALFESGELQIAISTGGGCPAMAAWVRKCMEETFGPKMGEGLELMSIAREQLRILDPGGTDRRAIGFAAFFESPIWAEFLTGSRDLTVEEVVEWISSYSV